MNRITVHESCHFCKEERIFMLEVCDLEYVSFTKNKCPRCGARNFADIKNFTRWLENTPIFLTNTLMNRMMLLSMLEGKKEQE